MPQRLPVCVQRLQDLRAAAGVTQAELARRSGVSRPALSLVERGEQEPSWDLIRRLAKALGVSVAAFDGKAPPPRGTDKEPAPIRLLDAARAYARAYDQVEQQGEGRGDNSVSLFAQFQEAQVELNLAALDLFAAPIETQTKTKTARQRRSAK